jgi:hypothetical protein
MTAFITKLGISYGFKRPFNFRVAIPFLLNVGTLALVLLAAIFLFLDKGLNIGTDRFYFLTYIACFLIVGALVSRAIRLSYAILCWCIIDLSLGMFSADLRPDNTVTQFSEFESAFIYHPLLQLVPRPNWEFKQHVDLTGMEDELADARAAGMHVDSLQDRNLVFDHNSLGLRGHDLTREDLARNLIFVYGGSTTYDIGLTQGETWVEQLQNDLDNKYTVVNFGVVGHSTEEHLIYTTFYQNIIPKKPVCAIYYEGWNDAINAHLDHLDSAYADYHLLTMAARRPTLKYSQYSPLVLLASELALDRFDSVPQIPHVLGRPPVPGPDKALEAIYADHVKTLDAINTSRGIRTIFIGQIYNKDWPKRPNIWAPLVPKGGFPPIIERFNSILSSTAASTSAKYIDAGIRNFDHDDFVDYAHFAPSGAKKFAAQISHDVADYCR